MSKKTRFREPFHKRHGKRVQEFLKSVSQHLYHIDWSLLSQLSWKKSLLLTYKILGLLVNIFAADEKYPVLNRDNLTTSIQMQLSQKWKAFYKLFAAFLKSPLNLKYVKKKMTLIDFLFLKLGTPKT